MRKRFKLLSLLLLSLLLLGLVGCGDNNTNNKTNDSTKKNPPTNQEYYDYLTERYNHYFNNDALDTTYDIYIDDFTYDNTYDEFITEYNDSYDQLKTNLVVCLYFSFALITVVGKISWFTASGKPWVSKQIPEFSLYALLCLLSVRGTST